MNYIANEEKEDYKEGRRRRRAEREVMRRGREEGRIQKIPVKEIISTKSSFKNMFCASMLWSYYLHNMRRTNKY